MLLLPDILYKALLLLAGTSGIREPLLEEMCLAAAAELESRLKIDITPESIATIFISAAAFLAVSNYIQFSDLDDTSTIRAGNVTVSSRGPSASRANASALRKQAETLIAPYLADPDFRFEGVRG